MIKRTVRKFITYTSNFIKYIRKGGVVYVNVAQISRGEVLKGKRVLITGGTSGIGYAIADKFLSEGASVVITGRNNERLDEAVKKLEGNVHPLIWDVTDLSIVDDKIKETVKLLGGLDILINNAGIYSSTPFDRVDSNEWDTVMDTNLKSVYFICQSTIKHFLSNEQASKIINISSIAGTLGYILPYGISKWGINSITKGLAKKYFHKNIIINSIAPGVTATKINDEINIEENAYINHGINNRATLPEEIAEIALFLASDASNNIVGQNIVCDGGATLI